MLFAAGLLRLLFVLGGFHLDLKRARGRSLAQEGRVSGTPGAREVGGGPPTNHRDLYATNPCNSYTKSGQSSCLSATARVAQESGACVYVP